MLLPSGGVISGGWGFSRNPDSAQHPAGFQAARHHSHFLVSVPLTAGQRRGTPAGNTILLRLCTSKWDFVFLGVLVAPEWVRPQQVCVHKAYRAAYTLPPWMCLTFVYLPLQLGGVGCPNLLLRNCSLLLLTYIHASLSHSRLSHAAALYLLTTTAPFSEGLALRGAAAELQVRVHTHPFPSLHKAVIHTAHASD